ncbi:MAG TPA: type II secretion system protein [Firmicutes bacterium]|nr:type II secretion system protein [Bacillota bacterium]
MMRGKAGLGACYREEKGFTLLEVTASLLLLGFVAAMLVPVFSQFLSSRGYLSDRMAATFWAALKLEEVICGAERAQEGYCREPWERFAWRYHEEQQDEWIVRQVVTVKWADGTGERRVIVSTVRLGE